MSGFFVFIAVTLLCGVSVLGMALLSWAIKSLLGFLFDREETKETKCKVAPNQKTSKKQVPDHQQCRSSTVTTSSSDEFSTSLHTNPDTESTNPMVTIQFLVNLSKDHDALKEFLTDPESHIHWPIEKLELFLCIVDDGSTRERIPKRNNKNSKNNKRQLPHGLSDDLYNLILDRMEDGFRILVTSVTADHPTDHFLLKNPPRGSLLFTFDSIDAIPSADFLQRYLE
jgi:hypothetical protein